MNLFNTFDQSAATVVSFGVRTLLIADGKSDTPLARKVAGLGCQIETADELYAALDHVMDDPSAYELVIIDCDRIGGIDLGRRAHNLLQLTQRCIPVILISSACEKQIFPATRYEPTLLRAPLSAISLRVGFEHAMQEQLLMARAS